MRKLPVWTTYRHVVGFAFGRFFTVLRLTWLPIGALLAAAAALVVFQFSMMAEMMPGAPGRSMRSELNPGSGISTSWWQARLRRCFCN